MPTETPLAHAKADRRQERDRSGRDALAAVLHVCSQAGCHRKIFGHRSIRAYTSVSTEVYVKVCFGAVFSTCFSNLERNFAALQIKKKKKIVIQHNWVLITLMALVSVRRVCVWHCFVLMATPSCRFRTISMLCCRVMLPMCLW